MIQTTDQSLTASYLLSTRPIMKTFNVSPRIEQTGVCGIGYYRMGVETGTTYFASMGCSGVSDENEAEFTFADGYLRLDIIDTENESGSFSGVPIRIKIDAYLHVWGDDIDIEGGIELERTARRRWYGRCLCRCRCRSR